MTALTQNCGKTHGGQDSIESAHGDKPEGAVQNAKYAMVYCIEQIGCKGSSRGQDYAVSLA